MLKNASIITTHLEMGHLGKRLQALIMLILVDVFGVFFKGIYVHKGIETFMLHVQLCY
jgi:hypothetical protein